MSKSSTQTPGMVFTIHQLNTIHQLKELEVLWVKEFQVRGGNLWSAAERLTVTQWKKVSQKNTEAWRTLEGIPIGQIWDNLSIKRIQMVMEYDSWVLKETTSPLRETDKRVGVGGLCYLTLEGWLTNMNRMTKFKKSICNSQYNYWFRKGLSMYPNLPD